MFAGISWMLCPCRAKRAATIGMGMATALELTPRKCFSDLGMAWEDLALFVVPKFPIQSYACSPPPGIFAAFGDVKAHVGDTPGLRCEGICCK